MTSPPAPGLSGPGLLPYAPPPPRRRLIRASLAVAGVTIFAMLLLTRTELFQEFEAAARDAEAHLLAPRESDRIVIVEVDDLDYDTLFGGVSPLAPTGVARVLDAILAGRPRAVGVDLETSHPMYRDFDFSSNGTPVIWAREAVPCEVDPQKHDTQSNCHRGALIPLAYLGGRESQPFGLVTFQADHQGTIRRYQRAIPTTRGPMPSLPSALAWAIAGTNDSGATRDTALLSIEFRRGEPLRLTTRTILEWAADPTSDYKNTGVLRDRIVLLGGQYRVARDMHPTPLGVLSGVEIVAQALETELDGSGRPTPSPGMLLLVQSITVLLLVALFVQFSFSVAFLLSLAALPALALVGGWIATGVAFTGFAYFFPLLIVMLIHILYEKVIEYREAFMVELVRQVRGEASARRAHMPVLERVEARVGRSLTWARAWISARSARTRVVDEDATSENHLAEMRTSLPQPPSHLEGQHAEPDGGRRPPPPDPHEG